MVNGNLDTPHPLILECEIGSLCEIEGGVMRSIIVALLFIPCILLAAPNNYQVLYDTDAVIEFADEELQGSSDNITIDNKSYLIDPIGLAQEQFQQLKGNHEFHKTGKTVPGTVVGFIVEEKGHFPNPTAKFKVLCLNKML